MRASGRGGGSAFLTAPSSPAAHESSHLPRGTPNCVGMATRVRTAAVWVSSGFSLVFEKLFPSADVCTVHLFLGNGLL